MGKQRQVRDIPIFRLLGPQLHRQGPAQGRWLGTPAGRRQASQRKEGTSSGPGEEWVGRKWAAWGAGSSQPPRLVSMMPRWSTAYSNARHLTASVWDAHSREDSGFIVIFFPTLRDNLPRSLWPPSLPPPPPGPKCGVTWRAGSSDLLQLLFFLRHPTSLRAPPIWCCLSPALQSPLPPTLGCRWCCRPLFLLLVSQPSWTSHVSKDLSTPLVHSSHPRNGHHHFLQPPNEDSFWIPLFFLTHFQLGPKCHPNPPQIPPGCSIPNTT